MSDRHVTTFAIDQPFALPAADVLARLQSSHEGLSPDEARRRLKEVGPNQLPPPEKDGLLTRFFKQLLAHWVDTGVILGVVVLNAVIGFIQEGKAEQALEGIRRMLSLHAHVRRGGDWTEIEADALVPHQGRVDGQRDDDLPSARRLPPATAVRTASRVTAARHPVSWAGAPGPCEGSGPWFVHSASWSRSSPRA
jgi:hypothetical protein